MPPPSPPTRTTYPWERLRAELRRRCEDLARVIQTADLSDEQAFGSAVGTIAHAAYHLGAIRQKAVSARGT